MSKEGNLTLCDYLEHILQASERIERYLVDVDFTGFMANEEKQDAVIRNLEIIGEAAANIRRNFPEFSGHYPDFPLKSAYGMRNALVHGYFKVDLEIVWQTIVKDVPRMRLQVDKVLASLALDSRGRRQEGNEP